MTDNIRFTLLYIVVIRQLILVKTNDLKTARAVERLLLNNLLFHDNYFLIELGTTGKIRCSKACTETDECVSFFYNHYKRKCRLHSTGFYNPDDGTPESNWTYYKIGESWCPVQDGFVHERTSNMCICITEQSFTDRNAAQVYCRAKNASLISFKTALKISQFTYIMNKINMQHVEHNSPNLNRFYLYIGLYNVNGTWKWDDGSIANTFNWRRDQLTCTGDSCNCVTVGWSPTWNWEWKDLHCHFDFPAICEVSLTN